MWPRVDGMRALELGTPGEMRARLNALALAGRKRATALRARDYADDGEEMEHVGELLVLVDDTGAAVATVQVTEVTVHRFADVPAHFVEAEGEDFADAAEWRSRHRDFWNRFGDPVTDDTPIACLSFQLVGISAPPTAE